MFCVYIHGACVGVSYLLILHKAEVELLVYLCVIGAAPHRRHQDHSPLLALELLHRTDLTHTNVNALKTLILFDLLY